MEQAPFPETTVLKCTRPGNAEKQPGQILFDTGIIHKCHTKAEKAADDQHCLEAKAAIQKAVDKGIECLALIEMETEAKENEAKAKKAAPPPTSTSPAPLQEKSIRDWWWGGRTAS